MNKMTGPTTEKQRYQILDLLRGFSLVGIALANFPEFALWTFLSDAEQAAMPTAAVDRVARFVQYLLVDGKFYTIFSLLFGVGFSLILARHGLCLECHSRPSLGTHRSLAALCRQRRSHGTVLCDGAGHALSPPSASCAVPLAGSARPHGALQLHLAVAPRRSAFLWPWHLVWLCPRRDDSPGLFCRSDGL